MVYRHGNGFAVIVRTDTNVKFVYLEQCTCTYNVAVACVNLVIYVSMQLYTVDSVKNMTFTSCVTNLHVYR